MSGATFPMDLARAPFAFDAMQSPHCAAVRMVAAFAHITGLDRPAGRVFEVLMTRIGVAEGDPVRIAGSRLAAAIDDGAAGGHRNPYHNVRHFCEVMLCAFYVATLQGVPKGACAEVVLAALVHDLGHDGGRNGSVAFRLERASIALADAAFGDAALDPSQRRRLQAAVLATEFLRGQPYALACFARHSAGEGEPALPVPPEAPELAVLADDPVAALQALILCEADVLPSVGLTFGHALKLQAELSAEWHTALGVDDKLAFIDTWRRRTRLSRFFEPNVDELEILLRASRVVATPAPAAGVGRACEEAS